MSSETFVSAMLLITGVVAAAILIVAVLPVIWGMVGTFSSASAATDRSMRTDFKIVVTYARWATTPGNTGVNFTIYMKNIGTTRIGTPEIETADVLVGKSTDFTKAALTTPYAPLNRPSTNRWTYKIWEQTGTNSLWEPGETLQVDAFFYWLPGTSQSGQPMYFQFTLPSGVSRSTEFTAQ